MPFFMATGCLLPLTSDLSRAVGFSLETALEEEGRPLPWQMRLGLEPFNEKLELMSKLWLPADYRHLGIRVDS